MKLNFRKVGEGKPLVILHGLFGSADNWLSIARELEQNFTLYLVDQRNHGDSPHSAVWDYDVMVKDLKKFLDEEGLGKVFLMGHSMGGKTAMNFAVTHPNRVEKLIIVDIAPRHYPVQHQDILNGLNSLQLANLSSRKEADEELSKTIQDAAIRQFLLKSLTRDNSGFVWKINLPIITQNIENVGVALDEGYIYKGPTLFLAGANSDYIRQKDMVGILEFFPDYELELIADAGHWIHAEQPKAVVDTIRRFLR